MCHIAADAPNGTEVCPVEDLSSPNLPENMTMGEPGASFSDEGTFEDVEVEKEGPETKTGSEEAEMKNGPESGGTRVLAGAIYGILGLALLPLLN